MADPIDLANDTAEFNLNVALVKRKPELVQIGICHNCTDVISNGLFCDSDCRDDFEKREFVKAGKPRT